MGGVASMILMGKFCMDNGGKMTHLMCFLCEVDQIVGLQHLSVST